MKRILILFSLTTLIALSLFPAAKVRAANSTTAIVPSGIVTTKGSTGGQPVGNLGVQDQSGTADTSSKYVTFKTPNVAYKGYRQYFLPSGIARTSVSAIQIKVNYKGPAKSTQTWTWLLYNWSTKTWVSVGTSSTAKNNIWMLFTFSPTSPQRFINTNGEMRLQLQSNNASGDAKLDFESLIVTYPAPSAISLSVDAAANRKNISPYIYGLNFAKESFANEINLPVRRWGGNATSRYNWQTGNTNNANDWYYENQTASNAYTWDAETHTQWIDQNVNTETDSLITIPMMGYVAKDNSSCGFNADKYGAQQDTDVWRPKCGNGVKTNGVNITGNNPLDTSLAVDETFMNAWVDSLVTEYGDANNGGVRFYALDNEPELWSETHRDIHPLDQSYAELVNKTIAYGAAVKSADPNAKIFGYAAFGWTGYWYSWHDAQTAANNGYTYFPDYATHGNMYQVEYYLDQMHQYEIDNSVRLLDYLDLHYYPDNGIALTTAGNTNLQALRLRSTRSLWDATYIDESWIGGADQDPNMRQVNLISRMKNWVNTYYPNTKLAITEYNFGGLESMNGALAQADILGIFGREGLDFATLWNYPLPENDPLGYNNFESLPGAYAFRMFRNYDGTGNTFGDVSVSAASADQSQLAIYAAQRSNDSALTLIVINKTGGALTGNISLANFTASGNAKVYRYSSANLNAIQHLADITTSTNFSMSFPANSITLIVIP